MVNAHVPQVVAEAVKVKGIFPAAVAAVTDAAPQPLLSSQL